MTFHTFYWFLVILFSFASTISVTNDGPQVIFLTPSSQFVINLYVQSDYTGYKPFVDLVLPTVLQFQSVSSNIGAITVVKTPLSANQLAVHPLTNGQISSTFNCSLYSMPLPFTLINQNQPLITLTITGKGTLAQIEPFMDYLVQQRGGFLLGTSPNGTVPIYSAGGDGTLIDSWTTTQTVTWVIFKINLASPGYVVSGPSFGSSVTATMDCSQGYNLTNISLVYQVPEENSVTFLNATVRDPTSNLTQPTKPIMNNLAQFTANNTWRVNVDKLSGNNGGDVIAAYNFFGTKFNASGALIVTDSTVCFATKKQIVLFYTASWMNPFTFANLTFSGYINRSLSLCYTDFSLGVSPTAVAIFDQLTYTFPFRVSDYYSYAAANSYFNVTIADGVRYDFAQGTPTISGTGLSGNVPFTAAQIAEDTSAIGLDASPATNGQTVVTFDYGAASGLTNFVGPATYNVKFYATVQEFYTDKWSANGLARLPLYNLDSVSAVASYWCNGGRHFTPSATSTANVQVNAGTLSFVIYAVDGVVCSPCPANQNYYALENVTYAITYTLPSQDFNGLTIKLNVPTPLVPVIPMSPIPFINDSTTVPERGHFTLGPATPRYIDYFPSGVQSSQTFSLSFGSRTHSPPEPAVIQLLYTYYVEDYPQFGEGTKWISTAIAQENGRELAVYLQLGAIVPTLNIGTAVIASSNSASTFPNCSTCATTPLPSTTCPRLAVGTNYTLFNGSTLVNVDGGDTFTVAVMVTNVGKRAAYDIILDGTLSMASPSPNPSATFCLTSAATGAPLAYSGASVFDGVGITLVDPIQPGDTVVATFDLLLDDNVTAQGDIVQLFDLLRWTSIPGGKNHVSVRYPINGVSSGALTTIAKLVQINATVTSDQPVSLISSKQVLNGELLTYNFTFKLPEGLNTLVFSFDTSNSFIFSQLREVVYGSSIVSTPFANATAGRNAATVDLGTIFNLPDNVADTNDYITISVDVLIANGTNNQALSSTFKLTNSTGAVVWSQAESLTVKEPRLLIDRSTGPPANPQGGLVGNIVLVVFRDDAFSRAPAFNAIVSSIPQPDYSLTGAPVVTASPPIAGTTIVWNATSFSVTFPIIAYPQGNITIALSVLVLDTVRPLQAITNYFPLDYSSSSNPVAARAYRILSPNRTITIIGQSMNASVIATSWYQTPPNDGSGNVALSMGEVALIEFPMSVIQGTNPNFLTISVDGSLLAHLVILSARVAMFGNSGITITNASSNPAALAIISSHPSIDVAYFAFDTILNPSDGNLTNDFIKVQVEVQPKATSSAVVFAGQVRFINATLVSDFQTAKAAAQVTLVKPQVTLTITQATSGTIQAGLVVTVAVTVKNAPQSTGINVATAFLVNLSIPINNTICQLVDASLVSANGQILSGSSSSDSTVQIFFPALTEGSTFVTTYQYLILNTARSNQKITLTPYLEWSSSNQTLFGNSGQAQNTTGSSFITTALHTHTVNQTGQSLATTTPPVFVVGETFTYNLTTTFVKGTTTPILSVIMPISAANDSLSIVSLTTLFVGPQIFGANITFNFVDSNGDGRYDQAFVSFGELLNSEVLNLLGGGAEDGQIVFSLTGIFRDVPAMTDGASFAWTSTISVITNPNVTKSTSLTARNPKITTSIVNNPVNVLVTNTYVSTIILTASDQFVYNGTTLITLPVTNIVSFATSLGDGFATNYSNYSTLLISNWTRAAGATISINITGYVLPATAFGMSYTITSVTTFTSTPGLIPIVGTSGTTYIPGRAYSNTGTGAVFVKEVLSTGLIVDSTSLVYNPLPLVTVGEVIEMQLTVVLARGVGSFRQRIIMWNTTGSNQFKVRYLTSSITYIGAAVTSVLTPVGTNGTGVDTNADGIADTASIDCTVTNVAIGAVNSTRESIVFSAMFVVLDIAGNTNGKQIATYSTVNFTLSGTVQAAAGPTLSLAEPFFAMTATPTPTLVDSTTVVTVAIKIQRTSPGSFTPITAYRLSFFDNQIANYFQVLNPSLAIQFPLDLDYVGNVTGGVVSLNARYLLTTYTLNFTYQIKATPSILPNTTYSAFSTNLTYYSSDYITGYAGRFRTVAASYSLKTISPTFKNTFTSSLVETNDTSSTTLDASIGEYIYVLTTVQLIVGTNPTKITIASSLSSVTALYGTVQYVSVGVTGSPLSVGSNATLNAGTNTLTYDFGSIVNSESVLNGTGVSISLLSTFLVTNASGSTKGAPFTLTPKFDYTTGSVSSAIQGTIVVATLSMTVTTNITAYPSSRLEAGDLISVAVRVQHANISNAAAYQISLYDLEDDLFLPLELDDGSLQYSPSSTPDISVRIIQVDQPVLPLGQVITMNYTLRVLSSVVGVSPSTLTDVVNVHYATADSTSASPRWRDTPVNFSFSPKIPTVSIGIVTTSLPTPQVSATNISMAIGESALLYLNVSLMRGVNIFETLVRSVISNATYPAQLELTSAQIVALSLPVANSNVSLGQYFAPATQSGFKYLSDIYYSVLNDDYLSTGARYGSPRGAAEYLVLAVNLTATDLANNTNGRVAAIQSDFFTPLNSNSVPVKVTIVEPILQWTKTVSGSFPLTSGGLPLVDAGTVLTYTATVSHAPASTSDAYQVLLAENETAESHFVAGSFQLLQLPTGSSISLVTGSAASILLDILPLGATFKFSYQSVITYAVSANRTVDTVSTLDYDSSYILTGSTGRHRNTIITSSVQTNSPTMSSAFTLSNQYGALPAGSQSILVEIGELITFETRVGLRPGLTPFTFTVMADNSASITFGNDTSPGSQIVVVNATGDINATLGAVAARDPSHNAVFLALGNVLDATAVFIDESLTIRTTFRVNNVPGQNNGFVTTIKMLLNFGTGTLANTLQTKIIEHQLAMTHAYRVNPAWRLVGGVPYLQYRDIVTWDVSIAHTALSNASAYYVVFNQDRMLEMTFVPASLVITDAGSGVGSVVVTSGNSTAGDSELVVYLTYMPRGDSFNFSYQTYVSQDVYANTTFFTFQPRLQSLSNYFQAATNDYVGRIYSTAYPNSKFGVLWPTVDIYRSGSSNANRATGPGVTLFDVSIGEVVTVYVVLTPILGYTPLTVTVNKTGVGNLTFLMGSIQELPILTDITPTNNSISALVNNVSLIFNLGIALNNNSFPGDNITLAIVFQIDDANPPNADGVAMNLTAVVDYATGTAPPAHVAMTIREPLLRITRSYSTTMSTVSLRDVGQAGDYFTWHVTIDHRATSTAAAYQVTLLENWPVSLLVNGSLNVTIVSSTGNTWVYSLDSTGHILNITVPRLDVGSVVSITYQTRVDAVVRPVSTYVSLDWLFEYYSADPSQNAGRRRNVTGSQSFDTLAPTMETHVSYSSLGKAVGYGVTTLPMMQIGEIIAIDTAITLIAGTNPLSVLVGLTGPASLRIISSNVMFIDGTISGAALNVGDNATMVNVLLNDSAIFDFGLNSTNLGYLSHAVGYHENITVRVYYVLLDTAVNSPNSGVIFTLTTTVNYSTGSISSRVNGTVAGPSLLYTKISSSALPTLANGDYYNGEWGSNVTFTVSIFHSLTSTEDAYQVRYFEPFSPDFWYYNYSFALIHGNANVSVVQNGDDGANMLYVIDQVLKLGETLNFSYTLFLSKTVAPQGTYGLVPANLTYNTADAQIGGAGAYRYVLPFFATQVQTAVPVITAAYYEAADYQSYGKPVGSGVTFYRPNIGEGIRVRVMCKFVRFAGVFVDVAATPVGGEISVRNTLTNATYTGSVTGSLLAALPNQYSVGEILYSFDNDTDQMDAFALDVQFSASIFLQATTLAANGTAFQLNVTLGHSLYGGFYGSNTSLLTGVVVGPVLKVTLNGPASYPAGDAGDLLYFTATVAHEVNSTGPAFSISLADLFTNIYTRSYGTPNITTLPYATTSAIIAGYGVNASISSLNVSDTVTIGYFAKITDDVVINSTLVQQVQLDYRTSADVVYVSQSTASNAWNGLANLPSFTITARSSLHGPITGLPNLVAAIGEIITIEMAIRLIDGVNPIIALLSQPTTPGGPLFSMISSTVIRIDNSNNTVLVPGSASTPLDNYLSDGIIDTAKFDFGNMQNLGFKNNSNIAIVSADFVVLDNPANTNGVNFSLQVQLTDRLSPFSPWAPTQTLFGPITEPILLASFVAVKDNATNGHVAHGESYTFTTTVTHDSTPGTGSTSDAYLLRLDDFYDLTRFSLVGDVVQVHATGASGSWSANYSGGFPIVIDHLAIDQTLELTYQLSLTLNVTAKEILQLQNESLSYASSNNTPARVRFLSAGAGANITIDSPREFVSVAPFSSLQLAKSFGPLKATVGEIVTFLYTVELINGITPLTASFSIPTDGLVEIRSCAITAIGPLVSGSIIAVNSSIPLSDSNADGIRDAVSANLGALANLQLGYSAPLNSIVLSVTCVPTNNTGTASGVKLAINASFDYGLGVLYDNIANLTVVEPLLNTTLTSFNPAARPVQGFTSVRRVGEIIRMQFDVVNIGGSPAYDVTSAQTFGRRVTPIDGSFNITLSAGAKLRTNATLSFTYNASTGNVSGFSLYMDRLDPGETVEVLFYGVVNSLGTQGTFYNFHPVKTNYASVPAVVNAPYDRFYFTNCTNTFGFTLVGLIEYASMYYLDAEYVDYGQGKEVGTNATSEYLANVGEGIYVFTEFYLPALLSPYLNLSFASDEVVFNPARSNVTFYGGSISNSSLALGDNPVMVGPNATFQFGPILENSGFNYGDVSDDAIGVTIYCQVANSSALINGSTFMILATMEVQINATYTFRISKFITGRVIVPSLNVTLSGPVVTSGDAGDLIEFSAIVQHSPTSNAPAFNIFFTDLFANIYTVSHATVNITSLSYATTSAIIAGNGVNASISSLNVSDTVTVHYAAIIVDGVVPNATLFQQDELYYQSSSNAIYTSYTEVSNIWEAITNLPSFVLNASSSIHGPLTQLPLLNCSIGEIITIDMTIHLIDGVNPIIASIAQPFNTTNGLFEMIAASVLRIDNSNNSVLGVGSQGQFVDNYGSDGVTDTAVFDFGNMQNLGSRTNNNYAVVRVSFVALDVVLFNFDGMQFTFVASLTYVPDQILYGIEIEPQLTITLQATTNSLNPLVTPSGVILVDIGDIISLDATVTHNLAVSDSSAFLLDFTTSALAEFNLTRNSIRIGGPTAALVRILLGNATGDATLDIGDDLLTLYQLLNINYSLQVNSQLLPQSSIGLNGSILLDYYSSDNTSFARHYQATPNQIVFALVPTEDLFIESTTVFQTNSTARTADLAIGEVITITTYLYITDLAMPLDYFITVLANSRGIVPLEILSSVVVYSDLVVNSTIANNSQGVVSSILASNDTIEYNFGNQLVDLGYLVTAPHVPITITTTFLVRNGAGLQQADEWALVGTFRFATSYESNKTISGRIVAPVLSLTLTPLQSHVQGGNTLHFTAWINHTSASLFAAYNVTVSDFLNISELNVAASPTGSLVVYYSADDSVNYTSQWIYEFSSPLGQLLDVLELDQYAVIDLYAVVTEAVYPEVNFSSTLQVTYETGPSVTRPYINTPNLSAQWIATVPAPNVTSYYADSSLQGALTTGNATVVTSARFAIGEEFTIDLFVSPIMGHNPLTLTLTITHANASAVEDNAAVISSSVIVFDDEIFNSTLVLGSNASLVALTPLRNATVFAFGPSALNQRFQDSSDPTPRDVEFAVAYRLLNAPVNYNGVQFVISADLNDGVSSFQSTLQAQVIEPFLIVDFNATKDSATGHVCYGETYSFLTTISHAPQSTADAYNLVSSHFFDPSKFNLVGNTTGVVITDSTGAVTSVSNFTGFPLTIAFLGLNSTMKIYYQLEVNINVFPSESLNIQNQSLDYASCPTIYARVRTIAAANNTIVIDPLAISGAISSPSSLNLTKTVSSFTATSGEIVGMTFTTVLASGLNPMQVRVAIPLNGAMQLMEVQLVSLGPNVTNCSVPVGFNATLNDTNSDGWFDYAAIDLGWLVNDGGWAMTNDVVIYVSVAPTNISYLTSEGTFTTVLNVTGIFDLLTPLETSALLTTVSFESIRPVTYVQPYLQTVLSRISAEPTVVPGDPILFELAIANTGGSIAYDPFVEFTGDFPFAAPSPVLYSVAASNGTMLGSQLVGAVISQGSGDGKDVPIGLSLTQFPIDPNTSLVVSFSVKTIAGSVPQNDDHTYVATAITSYDSVPDLSQGPDFFLRREDVATTDIKFFQQELNASGVCLGGVEISVLTAVFGLANPLFPNPIFEKILFEQFVLETSKISPNHTSKYLDFAMCFYWTGFRMPYLANFTYFYQIYTRSPYYLYYSEYYNSAKYYLLRQNQTKFKRGLIIDIDGSENVTTYTHERIPDVFYTTIIWFFLFGAAYIVLGFVFFVVPALYLWNRVRNPFTKRREWLQIYIGPAEVDDSRISAGNGVQEGKKKVMIEDDPEHERKRIQKEALRMQYTDPSKKKKGFYSKNPNEKPISAYLKKNTKLAETLDDEENIKDGHLSLPFQASDSPRKKAKKAKEEFRLRMVEKPWRIPHILTLTVGLLVRWLEISQFPLAVFGFYQVRRYASDWYYTDYHVDPYSSLDLVTGLIAVVFTVLYPFVYFLIMVFAKPYLYTSRYVMAALGSSYFTYRPEYALWTGAKLFRNLFTAMAIGIFSGFILPSTILVFLINFLYLVILFAFRPYKSWVFFTYDCVLSVGRVLVGILMIFTFWYNTTYGELSPGLEIALIVVVAVSLGAHFTLVLFWFVYYLIKKYRKYPQKQVAVLSLTSAKRSDGSDDTKRFRVSDAGEKASALHQVEQHIHESMRVSVVPTGPILDRKQHVFNRLFQVNINGGQGEDAMQQCDVYHLNQDTGTDEHGKRKKLPNGSVICEGSLQLEGQDRIVTYQMLAFENSDAATDYMGHFNRI